MLPWEYDFNAAARPDRHGIRKDFPAPTMRFEFNDCHPAFEILPSHRTHPRELRQSNPEIRRSLGFLSPVLSARSLCVASNALNHSQKRRKTLVLRGELPYVRQAVFRTMIVDEGIAGSTVSLREGATLAVAPGALRRFMRLFLISS